MLPANQPSLLGLVVSCTCMYCYPQIKDCYYQLQRLVSPHPAPQNEETLVNRKKKKKKASQKHMSGAKKKNLHLMQEAFIPRAYVLKLISHYKTKF